MTAEATILALWTLATLWAAVGVGRHAYRYRERRRLLAALRASGINGPVWAEACAQVENEVFRFGLKLALALMAGTVAAQRLWQFPGGPPVLGGWVNVASVLFILAWLSWWSLREGRR